MGTFPTQKRGPLQEAFRIIDENSRPAYEYPRDDILDQSKYVRLARRHHLENYRLVLWRDAAKWGLRDCLTKYQQGFFAQAGAVVAILNKMNGNTASILLRSTSSKDFVSMSLAQSFYGYDLIDPDFHYGDFVLVTEGCYDADAIRPLFKNALAAQTSNVYMTQGLVLSELTNNVAIAFDDDEAGQSGFEKAARRLEGLNVHRLKIYPGDKDLGETEEKGEADIGAYRERMAYYRGELQRITNGSRMAGGF